MTNRAGLVETRLIGIDLAVAVSLLVTRSRPRQMRVYSNHGMEGPAVSYLRLIALDEAGSPQSEPRSRARRADNENHSQGSTSRNRHAGPFSFMGAAGAAAAGRPGQACAEFFARYFDDRGYLLCVPRWSGDDGPDDALENLLNWTMLHALGADDRVLTLYKKGLEGHFRQYSEAKTIEVPLGRDGMYYQEFHACFDWMHHGEAWSPIALQGLSEPGDAALQRRLRRWSGWYMGESAHIPNYDPSTGSSPASSMARAGRCCARRRRWTGRATRSRCPGASGRGTARRRSRRCSTTSGTTPTWSGTTR